MKTFIHNSGYFLKEARSSFSYNFVANLFSAICIGLIFFILTMVFSSWWSSSKIIDKIQEEAEINVYFNETIDITSNKDVIENIKSLEGVKDIWVVEKAEAYNRMVKVLGEDSQVLEVLDENPFSPFVEIRIELDHVDSILEELNRISGVEHIRDNKAILDHLQKIEEIMKVLGYAILIAVGLATIFIVSHIIRLGTYHNREQINTLRLLGAPETFIALPFFLEGLLLTMSGGILAIFLSVIAINQTFSIMTGTLPFIPLPPKETVISGLTVMLLFLSSTMGVIGGIVGFKTGNRE